MAIVIMGCDHFVDLDFVLSEQVSPRFKSTHEQRSLATD